MTRHFETTNRLAGAEPPLTLNVLLLYEDVSTALRIKRALDHVTERLESKADFRLTVWRLDLLAESDLRQQVAREAAESDILVISMHGKDPLPSETTACLCQSLGHDPPHAIVLSLDESARQLPNTTRFLIDLRSMAQQAKADVFAHFGDAWGYRLNPEIERIWRRAETRSDVLAAMLQQCDPHPRWGINE